MLNHKFHSEFRNNSDDLQTQMTLPTFAKEYVEKLEKTLKIGLEDVLDERRLDGSEDG